MWQKDGRDGCPKLVTVITVARRFCDKGKFVVCQKKLEGSVAHDSAAQNLAGYLITSESASTSVKEIT